MGTGYCSIREKWKDHFGSFSITSFENNPETWPNKSAKLEPDKWCDFSIPSDGFQLSVGWVRVSEIKNFEIVFVVNNSFWRNLLNVNPSNYLRKIRKGVFQASRFYSRFCKKK